MADFLKLFLKFAALKRVQVDINQLSDVLSGYEGSQVDLLSYISRRLVFSKPRILTKDIESRVPALCWSECSGWQILLAREESGSWRVLRVDESGYYIEEMLTELGRDFSVYRFDFQKRSLFDQSPSLMYALTQTVLNTSKLIEICVASIALLTISICVSLFSMQVYDRVIPSGATSTLNVLLAGVVFALVFELLLKFSRSGLVEKITDVVDQNLARSIMQRFLSLRLGQVQSSVGATAQTLKGYETVRSFLVSLFAILLVDIPVSVFLIFVVALIGGTLAIVPSVFFLMGIVLAVRLKRRSEELAKQGINAHSKKTGALVEVVEASECIKANSANWRMLSRWLDLTDETRNIDTKFKFVTEDSQFTLSFFHQASYAITVAIGSTFVISGDLTLGGLIGCSILTGRILMPVSQVPNLMMMWANAKMSLKALDTYWDLDLDQSESSGIFVERLKPEIELRDIRTYCHGNSGLQLDIPLLKFKSGEKVAIIGPVGSGKSSLLRIIGGLSKPNVGTVYLGGYDASLISRAIISKNIGYVQQDSRLISGTTRDNLILGINEPGDDVLLKEIDRFNAREIIVTSLNDGLDHKITESGTGLSGGQKQLVQIIRSSLKKAPIFLLDEPTASLDAQTEKKVLSILREDCSEKHLSIFVTHKPSILNMVDRIIVLRNGRIIMDGDSDSVIEHLRSKSFGKQR